MSCRYLCGGHIVKENRQTQANFQWIEFWYNGHADIFGAWNRVSRGRS
ncbi:hypothetical protein [Bartonella quintana]|nr:hypothetical protein [Bartonella quintana]